MLLSLVLAAPALPAVPEALPGAPAFSPALRARLARELAAQGKGYVPRTAQRLPDGSPRFTNRLLLEASPYLRQHAHNPVNWYPWGDEAFETARRLGRPVLVSIGYSTCHWCHVMEEESFDDPELAALLNRYFVAIKVDRELRPDVDAVYMSAIQALGGHGGWPLNVWVTPERKPFFAGTYFPPVDRAGRPGLPSILRRLHELYTQQPERVGDQAERLARAVAAALEGDAVDASRALEEDVLERGFRAIAEGFDPEWGGRGRGAKFPTSLPVRFLLHYHRRSGDPQALHMALLSLEKAAAGGIQDQLGGGFHRYTVDRRWRVPHFEKMLYDNALRAVEYLEAWQASGREDFATVVRRTLDYVSREMTAPGGGFYSATDADSRNPAGELEEGRFFTWTPEELKAALSPRAAQLLGESYGVTPAGDLEGRSVLHAWADPKQVAERAGVAPEDLPVLLEHARRRLYAARAQRPAPLRDEKILAGWNGLMISAFARAGFALDEEAYTRQAARAADFVLGSMRREGRLLRAQQAGRASGPAFLSDYAFVIAGLLDLYEAASDPRWLREALALQEQLDRHHADADGGYFQTADDHERLIAREKPVDDGALPSGNSVAASNLLRLAAFTGEPRFEESASRLFSAFDARLRRQPGSLPALLRALGDRLDGSREIIVVRPADGEGGLEALLAPLRRAYLPNRILVVVAEGEDLASHATLVPLVAGKVASRGRATAYVCENRVCRFPTSDPELFARQLGASAAPGSGGGMPTP